MESLNQEELEKLEKERQNIYLTIKTLNIIIGILIVAIIFTLLKNTSLLFDQKSFASLFEKQQNTTSQIFTPTLKILIISSIALIVLISINQRLKKTIKDKISKAIYMPEFKEKDANFNHERGLTYKEVTASKLFPYPNRFESNNLVQGKISGFLYRASNITLWKRERKGKDVEETVIFDGRMYIIRTPFYKKSVILKPKNNKENPLNIAILLAVALSVFAFGMVVVIPRMLSSSVPSLFPSSSNNVQIPEEAINKASQQNLKFVMILVGVVIALILISLIFNLLSKEMSKGKKKYKKAQLESQQFNKYFDIETTDQIELRKTLTPAIMEKIINLKDSIGEFYLSIIGNRVFFAFPRPFNIRYDKPIQELIEEARKSTEREMETTKSIIETLKLEEEKMKKGI
jgi:heme/copper-type cytochrome/quinol oxidase subunit 2